MARGPIVAIASGKGGTGKTTIATNLALASAEVCRPVQYVDCDVEEPNGHIFLRPEIEQRLDVMVDIPEVNAELCTGCGKCGEICQYSAIVCIAEKVLTFEPLCHSCGGCMRVCPAGAITARPLKIGRIEKGGSRGIAVVGGTLEIGNVRSPSLIREVKRHISSESLTILDVPPGTACPVVAALRGVDFVLLVTEPTPFGLHDLRLAVELAREMELKFAVAINRDGLGDDAVEKYCRQEGIDIALRLADDRRIAEAYSSGDLLIDKLPEYREHFAGLAERLGANG